MTNGTAQIGSAFINGVSDVGRIGRGVWFLPSIFVCGVPPDVTQVVVFQLYRIATTHQLVVHRKRNRKKEVAFTFPSHTVSFEPEIGKREIVGITEGEEIGQISNLNEHFVTPHPFVGLLLTPFHQQFKQVSFHEIKGNLLLPCKILPIEQFQANMLDLIPTVYPNIKIPAVKTDLVDADR